MALDNIRSGLKAYRDRNKLTLKQMAETLGCHLNSLGAFERGISIPRQDLLDKICSIIGEEPMSSTASIGDAEEYNAMVAITNNIVDLARFLEHAKGATQKQKKERIQSTIEHVGYLLSWVKE